MLKLKEKLQKKELTIGSWLSFSYLPITEIMAKAGFEWLVIDMEHTAIDYSQVLSMVQLLDLANIPVLIRIGKNDELLIKKALEIGAKGIIVPMVNTKTDAAKAVSYAKYFPYGKRGSGLFRAQDYGMSFQTYREWNNENIIVIVQIEHIEAVKNLSDIVQVEGVDGFIIGPYDLSASAGFPGNFTHPDVLRLFNNVVEFMKNCDKPGGYHIVHTDKKLLEDKILEGYSFIAYGVDMIFFREKIEEIKRDLVNVKKKMGNL